MLKPKIVWNEAVQIVLGIALGALLTVVLLLPFSSPPRSQPANQQPNTEQQGNAPLSDLWDWLAKDSISFFTGVLAVLTGVVVFYNGRQIKLARDEFNATHRPKLDIRLIRFRTPFKVGQRVEIEWCIANIGDAVGTIFESNVSVMLAKEPLPAVPPYSVQKDSMGNITLAPGIVATTGKWFDLSVVEWTTYRLSGRDKDDGQSFFMFGYALYSAPDETKRSIAFCRRYDPASERFVVVDDPNYEHTA